MKFRRIATIVVFTLLVFCFHFTTAASAVNIRDENAGLTGGHILGTFDGLPFDLEKPRSTIDI